MAPRSNGEFRDRPRRRHRPASEGLEPRQLLSGAFPPATRIPSSPPGHTCELLSLTGDDGVPTTSQMAPEYSGPILSASEKAAALAPDGTYQIKGVAIGPGAFPHENPSDIEINF